VVLDDYNLKDFIGAIARGGSLPMSLATPANPLESFQWRPQPEAQAFVRGIVSQFLSDNPIAAKYAQRMKDSTGTRFIDWIDHLRLPDTAETRQQLQEAGYRPQLLDPELADQTFGQDQGIFPTVVLGPRRAVAIKVESVADFAAANELYPPGGQVLAPYRAQWIDGDEQGGHGEFLAVERHGYRGFRETAVSDPARLKTLHHHELLPTRPRRFDDEEAGFDFLEGLLDAAIADIGIDRTADIFFAAEREYWQRRNRAAQFQKARQDRLGLGWANHDHHTYRSSRRHFARLIGIFEKLDLTCRERFYAGREAGWGAQVMEQSEAGIVVFADVDLSPDELLNDFAHDPLPPRDTLGTVGLWCGLHGESILQAGMHHLECQFDFDALREQLESEGGVKVMNPFTDFPYLRQAFTEGERWPVDEPRIAALLSAKLITPDQADQFRRTGAIGSHLENLERNDGFKGFNQRGVSEIISATDPRKH
jgi:hypothetical protein